MISRTGLHAIRALTRLAGLDEGEFFGAAALAREIGAPENYLGKLLQALAAAGLVESRKGLGGGFRLARDPRDISLKQVLDPIEDLGRWQGCFLGFPSCSDASPCAVHHEWGPLRDQYLDLLTRTTLRQLVTPAAGRTTGRSAGKRSRTT